MNEEELRVAKAIWLKRPDCKGKPWPLETAAQVRGYSEPIAAVDLCIDYARAAIKALRSSS